MPAVEVRVAFRDFSAVSGLLLLMLGCGPHLRSQAPITLDIPEPLQQEAKPAAPKEEAEEVNRQAECNCGRLSEIRGT